MRKVICYACGAKNKKNSMFCVKCGKNLTEQTPADIEFPNTDDAEIIAESKKSKKPAVIIACALIGVIGGGTAIYMGMAEKSSEPVIEEETLFHDGLIPYKDGEYCGYLDIDGNVAINPQFDYVSDFSEGLACVGMKNGEDFKYGYIDTSGNYVVSTQYDDARDFIDGIAIVTSGDYEGVIDAEGNYIFNPQYEDGLCYVGNGMFLIPQSSGDYSILVDKEGTQLSQTRFSMQNFYSLSRETDMELIPLKTVNDKYCYINDKGETVINADYDDVYPFSEELAAVKVNEKWGYIDKTGEMVITPQFDHADSFSEGMAAVGMNNSKENTTFYGYINTEGKYILNTQYYRADRFKNGVAKIGRKIEDSDGESEIKYVLIDANGIEITAAEELLSSVDNKIFRIEEDDQYSFIDSTGAVIISQLPLVCNIYTDGYAVTATENKKFTIIDQTGNKIWGDKEFEGLGYYLKDELCKEKDCFKLTTYKSDEGYCSDHYEEKEASSKEKSSSSSGKSSSSSSSNNEILGTWKDNIGVDMSMLCLSDGEALLSIGTSMGIGTWSYDSKYEHYKVKINDKTYNVYAHDDYVNFYLNVTTSVKLYKED